MVPLFFTLLLVMFEVGVPFLLLFLIKCDLQTLSLALNTRNP